MLSHVVSRGNRKQAIVLDDRDRSAFIDLLAKVVEDMEWELLAYTLMGNHFHLVLELSRPNLTEGMHLLNSTYAHRFNDRHEVVGHLFEKRYRSDDVVGEAHFLSVIAYVARNPVAANLCRAASDWRWSSAAAAVGDRPPPRFLSVERLWQLVGPTQEAARATLRRLFERPGRQGDEIREAIRSQLLLALRDDGLTLRQLADALRISPNTVAKLLRP